MNYFKVFLAGCWAFIVLVVVLTYTLFDETQKHIRRKLK